MLPGARKLPPHHITIRVPWHDSGWNGSVCKNPKANTQCLVLSRIAGSKSDQDEQDCAGKSFKDISADLIPPCVDERSSFMAPFEITRVKNHPYAESSASTHSHMMPTQLRFLAYSAAAVPFRWMLKSQVEGDAKANIVGKMNELQLGYLKEREPNLKFDTTWVQERENQLVMLDTFFGALEQNTSLCFFYAKRTPLSEESKRVIVGVGRVLNVGPGTEYSYNTSKPPLRGMLWERSVVHSIRPGFVDGFIFPYQELVELSKQDADIRLEDYVAFAPSDFYEQYSYGSELLPHDGAITSLLSCANALAKIKDRLPGPWNSCLEWIDREINRIWKARGAFPGLGSALCAFGLQQGNLMAYEIAAIQGREQKEWTSDPWEIVDAIFKNPSLLSSDSARLIGDTFQKKWIKLPEKRRALLKLISRCALTSTQATRIYQETERSKAGIIADDSEILANPYLMYEVDRLQPDAISFGTIDRGLFPDDVVRKAFPVPTPSILSDSIDQRRVRALLINTLEAAASEGSTLLPRSWVVQKVRELKMSPPCPLDEDTLAVTEATFAPFVVSTAMSNGTIAFQLDKYVETKRVIAETVRRRVQATRHAIKVDWRSLVDEGIAQPLPKGKQEAVMEERARREKSVALEEIYSSRFSVLIGSAGTGKTTLLRVLCTIKEVAHGGILLLAPTGKARVRLEEATGMRGQGKTLAQFLSGSNRYDGRTGRYFPNSDAPKSKAHKTVIVDECSMLTEEQLGALINSLQGVERLILVGDPRQLPPIGAGRPFVDIVSELAPSDIETTFPKCGLGYAELTVTRRQQNKSQDDRPRDDLLLAAHFSGKPLDPGADELWSRLDAGDVNGIKLVSWKDQHELQSRLLNELIRVLDLKGPDDETGFEVSLGGSTFGDGDQAFFWAGRNGNPGAAAKVEDWQILAPIRGTLAGVDAINRFIQSQFRKRASQMALVDKPWLRKIPAPLGPLGILWGDKVINLTNSGRRKTYPKIDSPYVANGDIGIVVGEYKTKNMTFIPKNLQVEFASQQGIQFNYWKSEFSGDEAEPALDLAYALTVHKTQGSEFGTTIVVIPNPCRMLSRELLYTSLTRHQNEIVLMCQGSPRELLNFADSASSDIARRLTNLFKEASPLEVRVGREKRFLEDRLIHRTERGEMVRSKSEVIVADKLHARQIDYAYERPVVLDGVERFPDFTITDDNGGQTFYWEHLGMLDDPVYEQRWLRKLEAYRRAGVLPTDEGDGPAGTLIITRDDKGTIDSKEIGSIIDKVILKR